MECEKYFVGAVQLFTDKSEISRSVHKISLYPPPLTVLEFRKT